MGLAIKLSAASANTHLCALRWVDVCVPVSAQRQTLQMHVANRRRLLNSLNPVPLIHPLQTPHARQGVLSIQVKMLH